MTVKFCYKIESLHVTIVDNLPDENALKCFSVLGFLSGEKHGYQKLGDSIVDEQNRRRK